jgi:hypothetical protein
MKINIMNFSILIYRLGVNIKDADERTPIHSAFRSSNNLNPNKSNPEKQFNIDTDLGNKVFQKFIHYFKN